MSDVFHELYADLLNEVFLVHARQQLAQGGDAFTLAQTYVAQGKPDFTLAYLLLSDRSDEMKRDLLAQAYERRAIISEEKAAEFDRQYRRPFPLIMLEAQKDRLAAQQVRRGERVKIGRKLFGPL